MVAPAIALVSPAPPGGIALAPDAMSASSGDGEVPTLGIRFVSNVLSRKKELGFVTLCL